MPQSLPAFIKTWNFDKLNVNIPYVSLNDTMATLLYNVKDYLVGTMGATVVCSSTGAAAGSSDLWSSKAACTTRGATTVTPQSYCVINWADAQIMLSYTGSSDDMFRFAYSAESRYRINTAAASFTFTAATTDVCTAVGHGQVTGNGVFQATSTTSLPTGLSLSTNYWIIRIDNDTFKLAASYENAIAGVAIDITSIGSGTHTLANPGPTALPGAFNESIVHNNTTLIGAGSAARVFSIQAASDRSIFRCWVFSANVLQQSFGIEKVLEAPGIAANTLFAWNSPLATASGLNSAGHHAGASNSGAGGAGHFTVFVGGAQRQAVGGSVYFAGSLSPANTGALNGGFGLFPLLVGCEVSVTSGWIGTRYDAFHVWAVSGSLVAGQTADDPTTDTRVVLIGTMMTPWSPTQGVVRA